MTEEREQGDIENENRQQYDRREERGGEEGGRRIGGEGGRISKGRGIINERERKEWWNETGREWKEEKLTN